MKITTIKDVFTFIEHLAQTGQLYHFDDKASMCFPNKTLDECNLLDTDVQKCIDICDELEICIYVISMGYRSLYED